MYSVSIVIPAYNEEKRIGETLKVYSEYFENLRKKKELNYELLVVINNTSDKTEEIVKLISNKNPRIKHINLEKGGKGYATIEGFKESLKRPHNLIGFVDADLATRPPEFHNLIKNISDNGGIIASRYLKDSIVNPRNTIKRIIASRIYNMLIRVLFLMPFRDTQCGAKLFSRKAIELIVNDIGMTKFAFDLEIIYKIKLNGLNIIETPTRWADKSYSTINFWKSGPIMALAVIRLRIIHSPLRRFIRIYDRLIGIIPK